MRITIHRKSGDMEGVLDINDGSGTVQVVEGSDSLRRLVEERFADGFNGCAGNDGYSWSVKLLPGDSGLEPIVTRRLDLFGLRPVFPGRTLEQSLAVRVFSP